MQSSPSRCASCLSPVGFGSSSSFERKKHLQQILPEFQVLLLCTAIIFPFGVVCLQPFFFFSPRIDFLTCSFVYKFSFRHRPFYHLFLFIFSIFSLLCFLSASERFLSVNISSESFSVMNLDFENLHVFSQVQFVRLYSYT